jgi:hypothetical protein
MDSHGDGDNEPGLQRDESAGWPFYFRDPSNNQAGINWSNPAFPGPGQTVPFTFGPVTNPTSLVGKWTALVSIVDDLGTRKADTMQTQVGP